MVPLPSPSLVLEAEHRVLVVGSVALGAVVLELDLDLAEQVDFDRVERVDLDQVDLVDSDQVELVDLDQVDQVDLVDEVLVHTEVEAVALEDVQVLVELVDLEEELEVVDLLFPLFLILTILIKEMDLIRTGEWYPTFTFKI